tara:strand:+ start:2156 stop:2377 length:222 start_codon:yes stop_codon:yes gene_type:complete
LNLSSFSATLLESGQTILDLPINEKELGTIVKALTLGGDTALYQKLKLVKETIEENPGGPYKKILRESHGMVI